MSVQTSDIVEGFRCPIVFKDAGLPYDLFFFAKNDIDVEAAFLNQRLCKDIFSFIAGQPTRGLEDLLPLVICKANIHLGIPADTLDDAFEETVKVRNGWQLVVNNRDFLFEFHGQLEHRG